MTDVKAAPASASCSGDRRNLDRRVEPIAVEPTEITTAAQRTDNDDLEARFELLQPPPLEVIRRFRKRGVSALALCKLELPASARVDFQPDRPLFDFVGERGVEGDGEFAVIFLARDQLGEPIDLVAWRPSDSHLAAWYGRTPLLGAESLWVPRVDNEGALAVFASPLAWLLAERRGVVIIDPAPAALALRDIGSIVADTKELGEQLDGLLNRPRVTIFAEVN